MDKDRVISVLRLAYAALGIEPYRCADVAWADGQNELRANARRHIARLLNDLGSSTTAEEEAAKYEERIETVLRLASEALTEQPALCGSSGWTPAQARQRRDAKRALRLLLAEFAKEKEPTF